METMTKKTKNEKITKLDLSKFKGLKINQPGILIYNDKEAFFLEEKEIIKQRDKIMTNLFSLDYPKYFSEIDKR